MQAIIKKEYSKGFLLNEEHLIKLDDICRKRFAEIKLDQILAYKVYRSDALVFDTDEYQVVLDEENSKRNTIEKVRITSASDRLKFTLSFDSDEGVSLSVEAESKDMAYLLFSDVKDYLITEILCFRSFSFKNILSHRTTFPFIMLVAMLIMTYTISTSQLSSSEIQELISNGTVDEKLNYLLASRGNRDSSDGMYPFFGVMMVFVVFLFTIGPVLDRIFPRNIFCWGKTASTYSKLVSLRGKILWGVFIAFIISALASLSINFISIK